MTQHAIAFPTAPFPSRKAPYPGLDETIAAISGAGRLIADLKVRLEAAERSIAALQIDKRALEDALRVARRPHPLRTADAEATTPGGNRSHLDDALAAIAQGLGASIARDA